jgi:hypothetical protein
MATVNIFGGTWKETPEADVREDWREAVDEAGNPATCNGHYTAVGAYQGFDMWLDELIKAAT